MKKSIYILTVLFTSLITFSFVQNSETEIKEWSKQSKLSWQDFKGKPNNSGRAAISDCRISSKMKGKKDSVLFIVESYFSITDSWVKHSEENDFLLKHEQGHFDINEIFARKFRQALKEAKLNKGTLNSDFRDLQVKYFTLLNKEQVIYDNETKHSANKVKQLEWDKKIEAQLLELELFNSSKVIVPYSK